MPIPRAPAKVAVVGPLTGRRAGWGKLLTESIATLAHAPVRWELLDDRGDAAEAVGRADEVIADGGFAAVVGHFNSQGAKEALPAYRAAGLAVLLPLATAPGLTDGMTDTALRLCPDDAGQAAAIVAACRERGQQQLIVVRDASGYGAELSKRLLACGDAGLSVCMSPQPPAEGVAGAVALCGVHHWVADLLRQWRPERNRVIFAGDDCDVADFAELAGGAATQVLVARLPGGARPLVASAFAALAGALAKHPEYRGRELLAAVRAELAGDNMPGDGLPGGWDLGEVVTPSTRPGRRRGTVRTAAAGTTAVERCDVLVVGGGVVGLGTAAELAGHGVDVVLVDDGRPGSTASAVSGALVRAFEPGEFERDLALHSFNLLWGRPERAAAYGLRRTGGLVLLGSEHLVAAETGVAALRSAGMAARLLAADDLARRWPALNMSGLAGAVWEPGAGYALPTVTLAALRDRAMRAGARILSGVLARGLAAVPSGAGALDLDGITYPGLNARVVVVAAGCASPGLLGARWPADRPATTRRIRYGIFAGGRGLPALIDLTTGMWGRPDGYDGYLVGCPVEEWDVPVTAGAELTPQQVSRIRTGVERRLPFLAAAPYMAGRFGTDLYVTGGAVLDAVPGTPHTVVAAGWSGGGFKTAPAAARRAATAAVELLDLAPV